MDKEKRFEKELFLAKDLALRAGRLIKKLSFKKSEIKFKGVIDLVTNADIEAEKLIVAGIKKHFNDHKIVAEEGNGYKIGSNDDFVWIVDPLDGTTNYAHRFPFYATSIALAYKGEVVVGAIYDPNADELFYASKNGKAFLNDNQISVSETNDLNKALLATGFPYDLRENPDRVLNIFRTFALRVQGIRRAGAASLDLCYLACSRFDGFWELGLKPWDTAAASLILREAGGQISKFDGSKHDIWTPETLATNNHIHKQMTDVIKLK